MPSGEDREDFDRLPYHNREHPLDHLAKRVHKANQTWWHDPATGARLNRNKGEMIALMHSELSEMMEGERKNLMDDHLPHRRMAEVELADLIIRALDYAGGFDVQLGRVFEEKMAYNSQRPDHKPEERVKEGGKKW